MESGKVVYIRYKSANSSGFSLRERLSLPGLLRSYFPDPPANAADRLRPSIGRLLGFAVTARRADSIRDIAAAHRVVL
jgi:hypothetical protein